MSSEKQTPMAANKYFSDLQGYIEELVGRFQETKCPITDDDTTLHRLCDCLEYLLHTGLKEKHSILGSRNSYWEYFGKCLASQRRIHDGLRFVKSLKEFKTSLGRGRAFIRSCLVHRCIGDALQQCSLNYRVTSYFYDDTSILRQKNLVVNFVDYLYKLHEVDFSLSPRGYDLDVSWPTFDKKLDTMPHTWEVRSRSSSISSMNSLSGSSVNYTSSSSDHDHRLTYTNSRPETSTSSGVEVEAENGETNATSDGGFCEAPNGAESESGDEGNEKAPEGHGNFEMISALRAENEQLQLKLRILEQEKSSQLESAVTLTRTVDRFRSLLQCVQRVELEVRASQGQMHGEYDDEDERTCAVVADAIVRLKSLVEKTEPETVDVMIGSKEKTEADLERERLLAAKLDEAKAVVARLKVAHNKLHTSEAILRYELGEKRTLLGRLRRQLEASREQWVKIRKQNAQAEEEWKSLRAEFASRAKQKSEESGFSDEATESSCNLNSNEEYRTASPSVASSFGRPTDDGTVTASAVDTGIGSEDAVDEDEDDESRHDRRLRFLEEQCRLLYSKLLASRKKSEILEWRLAQLHEHYGPETEPEQVDGESSSSDVMVQGDEDLKTDTDECECCSTAMEEITDTGEFFNAEEPRSLEICEQEIPTENDSEENQSVDVDAHLVCIDEEMVSKENEIFVAEEVEEPEPDTLFMARSLPKRVEKLRLEKEEMHKELRKIKLERSDSSAREMELLAQINMQKDNLMELEVRLHVAEEERQILLQREVEFKKRADFIMRKERDDKESRFRMFVTRNLQLQSQVETLEHSLNVKLGCIRELEEMLQQTQQDMEYNKSTLENEVESLKLLLITEASRCQQAVARHSEHSTELTRMRDKVSEQERHIHSLDQELADIRQHREEEKVQLEELNLCLTTREEECTVLNGSLREAVRVLDNERHTTRRLQRELDFYKSENAKLKAELTQLYSDSTELKSRIIKLIRDKDMLWKRSEKLSFIQKVNAAGRWMNDDEASHCLSCKAEFTLVLRKHHCRLCGRIFCSSCSSNWALTTASSRRVRVCSECTIQHSSHGGLECESPELTLEGDESDTQSRLFETSSSTTPSSSSSELNDPKTMAVSIPNHLMALGQRPRTSSPIVSRLYSSVPLQFEYDSTSNPHGQGLSLGGSYLLNRLFGNRPISPMQASALPNDDEFCLITDEEIIRSLSPYSPYAPSPHCLDNSVNMAVTKTLEELEREFCTGNYREVWINAGKRYGVPILIEDMKSSLTWEFTTEPKSIAFMMEFRSTQGPEGGAQCLPQILVPTTRCDSHLQVIRGKLVAKKIGLYTFMFDNSFSRFTPKKVSFKVQVLKCSEPKDCEGSPVSFS